MFRPSSTARLKSITKITMSKWEKVKTVVVGGKRDVQQQYCGVVGGQSTSFSTIDSEIKVSLSLQHRWVSASGDDPMQSTGLKNHTLAPPDL